MSYDIEHGRWVILVTLENQGFKSPYYLGFSEIANSSLRDEFGPVKEVFCPYAGHGYHFMSQVVRAAASCEDGTLVVRGSHHGKTLPERYIALWREAQRRAVRIEEYLEEAERLNLGLLNAAKALEQAFEKDPLRHSSLVSLVRRIEETEGMKFVDELFLGEPRTYLEITLTAETLPLYQELLFALDGIGWQREESLTLNFNFAKWAHEVSVSAQERLEHFSENALPA